MSIFKACDIRGIVGKQWDAQDAQRIGHGLGILLRRRSESTIFVGGDYRATTAELKKGLCRGLLAAGIKINDVGRAPTPLVYFAARRAQCGNAAIVTASHNPAQYNGVKFMVANQPAVPQLVAELQQAMRTPQSDRSEPAGQLQRIDVVSDYKDWLAQEAMLQLPAAAAATPVHVVLDTMHGAFSGLAPQVLEQHGYRVTALHNQVSPDFHGATPNPARDANLQSLVDEVRRLGADVGAAMDGDGDRILFVDDTGRIVRPEQIAVLLMQQLFPRGTIVYDLKCASIVARHAKAAGGRAIMQPSGHGFIKSALQRYGAELGVEVSGHHFFRVLAGGDDALFTALVVLRMLRLHTASLAELCRPIGWPVITPDLRIPYAGDADSILERLAATCGGHVCRLDGVRAEYADGQWALARASITEPALTLRFEGRNSGELRMVAEKFLAGVPDLQQQVMELLDD